MTKINEQHSLKRDEVHRRLRDLAVKVPDASSIALTLGGQLLEEVMNRSSQIDSKGISVLGWSSALLAFLLVHAPKIYRSGSPLFELFGTTAMALAFLAAFSGMWASRKRQLRGTTDETWFPDPNQIVDAEHLRQHYLKDLHESRGVWHNICLQKAYWLGFGQSCLALGAFLVVLMMLYTLVALLAGFDPTLVSTFGEG